jgi:transcriptional regulator
MTEEKIIEEKYHLFSQKFNKVIDKNILFNFIKEYNFGELITNDKEGYIVSTHVPFLIEKENDEITLYCHLALANNIHYLFEKGERKGIERLLLVFNGPHGKYHF